MCLLVAHAQTRLSNRRPDTPLKPSPRHASQTVAQTRLSNRRTQVVVGPLRSTVSEASALLLGVRNTPQVSYGSSSPTLSDTSLYPRFFRTFPSDASAATTICQLLSDQLDLAQVGVFYSSDTYGEGYMKALQSDCSALGVEVQGWAYEIGNHQSIRTVMSNLEASAVSVVIFVFLDTADLAMLIEAGLELQSLGKSKPRLLVLPEALDLDSLSSAAREVLHGSLALRSIGGTTANPRWAAFASQGWYNLNASAFNQLLPEPFHLNQSIFGPTFDASNSYYLRNLGTYEYDAMAAVGLLACQVAPSGALPADFGTQLWNAATSADFEFEGLSGVVRFDERGDRNQLTVNIQLYNVLQAANGSHVELLVASYDGTKAVPWGWRGGSMSASGVVFNGGADTPPNDIAPASDSSSPFAILIAFSCMFGGLFLLIGVYLLAKYKKGKQAEAKRRKTEEELAKAKADAQRERNLMGIIFHELRNPLNGVVAHLRLGSQSPSESAERLQSALVCTEHALSFLNGLSQIEKLEASAATALRIERCSLYEVVRSVITIVSPQLKPGVKLLTRYPPETLQVELDRTVLAQVLINLLQNAAANTSSGFVELVCSAAANSASEAFVEVALTVRDTGKGMSEEVQAKIFDRYQSVGGIGLGMYLTKLQIQQMGSSISVQSPWTSSNGEQHGAQFSFALHLEAAPPSPKIALAARALPVEIELPEPQLPRRLRVHSTTAATYTHTSVRLYQHLAAHSY